MKTFSYTALESGGREVSSTLPAVSLREALTRLHELGLFPVKVREVAARSAGGSLAAMARAIPRRRSAGAGSVPLGLLTYFTRQLATMIEAGLPLLRSLQLLEQQERHRALKRVLGELGSAIEGGSTLSEAMGRYPRVFSPLYVNMVRAGEIGGVLDLTLRRLAEFMEKARKIRGKVTAAMFYPAAVLTVAGAILAVLMVFVVPRFEAVFADLLGPGRGMHWFTTGVLGVSRWLAAHFPAALGLAAMGVVIVGLAARTRLGRRCVDRLKLGLPILGPVFRKAAVARFARTLGTLLNSGVPILQALAIVRETSGNLLVADAVGRVHAGVKEGETVARPLGASAVFPVTVVGMVDVGEQTGALPDMLTKVADIYDDEVDNAVSAMTSLLEPLLIVVLAVVVGSIVIAMFLPLIEIITGMTQGPTDGDGL